MKFIAPKKHLLTQQVASLSRRTRILQAQGHWRIAVGDLNDPSFCFSGATLKDVLACVSKHVFREQHALLENAKLALKMANDTQQEAAKKVATLQKSLDVLKAFVN